MAKCVNVINMKRYLRARVHPIELHLDPTVIVSQRENAAIVAYGVSTSDLLRVKSFLPNLNNLGLMLLKKLDSRYGFLLFDEMLVCIHPGFQSAIKQMNLHCGFDFRLEDLTGWNDLLELSRWITLKEEDRVRARKIGYDWVSGLVTNKVSSVLGSGAAEVLIDLVWATSAFEPAHALTFIAKGKLASGSNIRRPGTLQRHGATLHWVGERQLLLRKRKSLTLIDVACYIFSPEHYFEVEEADLARALNMPTNRISSHLRGYLVVDEAYVRRIKKLRARR